MRWILAFALPALGACRGEPEIHASALAGWIDEQRSPIFWSLWADVRDFVGEERWSSLQGDWMQARAAADVGALDGDLEYAAPFVLSGLWRCGYEREAVLQALAKREPEAQWPLEPGADRRDPWRPRLARWRREHGSEGADELYDFMLLQSWEVALAERDSRLAARVAEARAEYSGEKAAADLRDDALALVRLTLASNPRARDIEDVVPLIEQFGAPDDLALDGALEIARARYDELKDATIPLPHPYDLYLLVLRLERLRSTGTEQ